jgi:hypothetical protein
VENFSKQSPRNSEPIKNKSTITKKSDNSLLSSRKENNSALVNYQPQPAIKKISPKIPKKFSLNSSEQLPVITSQQINDKEQVLLERIKQLEKTLTNEQEKRALAENNLVTQKQTNNNLYQQLQAERRINVNLRQKLHAYEQNYSNLFIAYQNTIKDKQKNEILAQSEKKRANNYEQQLKTIARMLYQ